MKNWIRIFFVFFFFILNTAFFSYWIFNQFNNALDNLSAPTFANTHSVYPSFKQNTGSTSTSSISSEISGELTMSTSTDSELASISPEISVTLATSTSSGQATSTDPKLLSFTSSQKDTKVYVGCTYTISWQPSTMISSLEAALIDAGAREAVPSKTSGLAKENTIEKKSQNLNWKVGFVWPGAYYIKISKINGVEAVFRSKVFEINNMPKSISAAEREKICKESESSSFYFLDKL